MSDKLNNPKCSEMKMELKRLKKDDNLTLDSILRIVQSFKIPDLRPSEQLIFEVPFVWIFKREEKENG